MTYDEAKKSLKELLHLKKLLRVKERQIAEERKQISVAAVDYSKERTGSEAVPLQQRFVERVEKLEAEYIKLFERMCAVEDMIADKLPVLTALEQSIIIDRYMNGKSWSELETEYSYSIDSVYRIHSNAIHKIAQT